MRQTLVLNSQRQVLEGWARSRTMPHRLVLRGRIILMLGDGHSAREVARTLGVSRNTVDLWKRRFMEGGCEQLMCERPGRGRKSKLHKHAETLIALDVDRRPT